MHSVSWPRRAGTPPTALEWLTDELVQAGHVDKLRLPGLKEDRRAVIAGGVATLRAVFALAGIERMHNARGALRHGVLYEMLDRDGAAVPDVRERTVLRLQQKFGADADQAARVRTLAQQFHAALGPEPGPGEGGGKRDRERDRERERERAAQQLARKLGWAADVHEIGRAVAHDDYNRHGAYILEHSDGAGFALHQLERLGLLLLGQRGGLRKIAQWLDDAELRDSLLCLRLAVLLCHARRLPALQGMKLARRAGGYRFEVTPAWAQQHPRAVVLLEEEAAHWKRVERVFEFVVG